MLPQQALGGSLFLVSSSSGNFRHFLAYGLIILISAFVATLPSPLLCIVFFCYFLISTLVITFSGCNPGWYPYSKIDLQQLYCQPLNFCPQSGVNFCLDTLLFAFSLVSYEGRICWGWPSFYAYGHACFLFWTVPLQFICPFFWLDCLFLIDIEEFFVCHK